MAVRSLREGRAISIDEAEGKAVASEGLKQAIRAHWDRQPCGTRDIPAQDRGRFFRQLEAERYALEPYIPSYARFERGRGRKVLEVGVGAGTDFMNWVRAGAQASGVDLTSAGVALTRERLALEGLEAEVRVADAEALPFPEGTFAIVYTWGVLHHSPDTAAAVREVHRVLKPGGEATVMIYHVASWTGLVLWVLHCAARLRPWRSVRWAMAHHLESPGTKAYTVREARSLFAAFSSVRCRTQLSTVTCCSCDRARSTDRASTGCSRRIYPRWLVRMTGNRFGLALVIDAVK